MQMHKIAFAGDTAERFNAQFDALKKKYPQLGDRAIFALMKSQTEIRREAIRLGFEACGKEVA